jgi:hypothetical protein
MTSNRYRLAQIKSLSGAPSANPRIADELTITAAVAYVAGEEILSTPKCVDEDLTNFLLSWSADLADADRNSLLLPLVPDLVGAHREPKHLFAQLALSWLIADAVPAWLAAISFDDAAAHLSEMPSISPSSLDMWSEEVAAVDRFASVIVEDTVGKSPDGAKVWDTLSTALRSTGEVAAGRTVAWALGDDSIETRVAQSCARLCASAQAILGEDQMRRLKAAGAVDPVASAILVVEDVRRARRDSVIRLVRRMIATPNLSVVAT